MHLFSHASTLANLGKDGRIPSDVTLAKLDDLLSWESGSLRGRFIDRGHPQQQAT